MRGGAWMWRPWTSRPGDSSGDRLQITVRLVRGCALGPQRSTPRQTGGANRRVAAGGWRTRRTLLMVASSGSARIDVRDGAWDSTRPWRPTRVVCVAAAESPLRHKKKLLGGTGTGIAPLPAALIGDSNTAAAYADATRGLTRGRSTHTQVKFMRRTWRCSGLAKAPPKLLATTHTRRTAHTHKYATRT